MSLTLLVPLDGSPLAMRALPVAAGVAAAGQGRLIMVQVETTATANHVPGFDMPTAIAPLLARLPVTETRVYRARPDEVPTVLLDAAAETSADLIVMSTHGRGGLGRLVFGSVANQLLRRADVPLLLVPPDCEADWLARPPKQILVALDGSRLAEEVLEPAAWFARVLGAEVLLVRALSSRLHARTLGGKFVLSCGGFSELDDAWHYLTGHADRLRASGIKASVWVVDGAAAATITAAARAESMDLIAMTTHGRGGLGQLLVGSIADGVLRRSPVPIMLVRSGMMARTRTGAEPVAATA